MRIRANSFFLVLTLFLFSCEWDSSERSWCQVIQKREHVLRYTCIVRPCVEFYLSLLKVFQLQFKTENKVLPVLVLYMAQSQML